MKIKVRHIEDIAVVDVQGRININSSRLIEAVGSLLNEGIRKIIINLENVDFIDYNGLSVIAITYKSTLNNKGEMKLCGISSGILELFNVVKLDEVFDIHTDLEEALDSFRHKKPVKKTKEEILEQPLRRRFKRLDIDIPVNYRLSKAAHKGEVQLYSGRLANMSGAGIFIRTINILPPGSEVDMEVGLKKGEEPKRLRGVVMWLADKDLQPDFYPGMGVAFIELSPRAQEGIIEFIEKHTVHRRG